MWSEAQRKAQSERMRKNNPMHNPIIAKGSTLARSLGMKGKKFPPRSEAHKKHLSEAFTQDRKKDISVRMKLNNPMKNPAVIIKSQASQKSFQDSGGAFGMMWKDPIKRAAVMLTIKKQRSTKEYRQRKSEWMTARMLAGQHGRSYCKSGHFYSNKNRCRFFYRSGMELDAYAILEADRSVISYDVECLKIPYVFKDVKKYYIPDIKVIYKDGTKALIEVKPTYKFKIEFEVAKLVVLKNYCKANGLLCHVWTEKDIYVK